MITWKNEIFLPAQIKFVWEGDTAYKAAGLTEENKHLFGGEFSKIFPTVDGNVFKVYAGMGSPEKLDGRKFKNVVAKAARTITSYNISEFSVDISALTRVFDEDAYFDVVAGVELGLYTYQGIHQENLQKDYTVAVIDENHDNKEATKFVAKAKNIADGMILTREWINTPGNYLTPEMFAADITEKLTPAGVEVTVLEGKQLEELGMGALLAVGNSSDNKPRLIVMKYTGNKYSDKVYGFVGKGVTVDTGGYSLKNSAGLMYTKGDMGGAAAVAGAIYAIAKNKLSVNVTAVIPAAENRLSNQSHIPGDVVTSMNGKTIEILNTDAEGRLILADAITYAVREAKVTHLVDVATLTGAVVGALGTVAAGCTTNDEAYLADFYGAAKMAGERYWQLPLFEEYEEMLKSKVADLKNMGGPNAGTIAAALFLREFVEDKPWIHLDIAGTSQTEAPSNDYHCFGGTGFATPSLYFLAENYQEFIDQ